jgi:hypothetical protein
VELQLRRALLQIAEGADVVRPDAVEVFLLRLRALGGLRLEPLEGPGNITSLGGVAALGLLENGLEIHVGLLGHALQDAVMGPLPLGRDPVTKPQQLR